MDTNLVTNMGTALGNFGTTILEYFVQILPALASLAAIFFVLRIVKRKVD